MVQDVVRQQRELEQQARKDNPHLSDSDINALLLRQQDTARLREDEGYSRYDDNFS
jgi:hypothetical protein